MNDLTVPSFGPKQSRIGTAQRMEQIREQYQPPPRGGGQIGADVHPNWQECQPWKALRARSGALDEPATEKTGAGTDILLRPKTGAMTEDVLRVATLTVPCLFGLWTAAACQRAQYHGLPGSDALVWGDCRARFSYSP
jgi:hypothetical protein